MYSQLNNSEKSAIGTDKRNFFQKTIILLAILAFTGFGFKAKAQTIYSLNINNSASFGCNWRIAVYDNGGSLITTINSIGGSGLTIYGCFTNVDHITVVYIPGGCMGYTFGSSGTFTYTSVTPSCTPPPSCSSNINCQGTAAINTCPSPIVGDIVISLNIN